MQELSTIFNALVAANILRDQMHALDHEEVWVLYLTSSLKPIGTEMISKGTLTETAIDCRTVLRQVLLHNAYGLVLLHNHPSGDPRPSQHDIQFTDNLRRACKLMDVILPDHIITSEDSFFSFAEGKTIPFNL